MAVSYPSPVLKEKIDDIQTGLYIAMAEVFLYGIYAALFGFYIHVVHTRGIAKNRFLSLATILLFLLCTAHLALVIASSVILDWSDQAASVGGDSPSRIVYRLNFATNPIYVTSNVLADSIFIFRCYAIWGFNDRIIFLPIVSTFGVGGLGYFDTDRSIVVERPLFNLSIATSVFTTIMLMALSAGRIGWLASKSREVLGRKITTRYHTASAMILESGALYCAGGIAYIIISLHKRPNAAINAFARTNGAVLGQLVGIAPTIISVRVGLGKSVDNVESFVAIEGRRVETAHEIRPAVAPTQSIQNRILYLRPNSRDEGKCG
ncbi:hypothetical protein C8R45DRAFT_1209103 [Mycena sanguinolenta]|nr:hypothetical protein C8R45DRAFT_1209103 [Mycena sanguinolenta]